MKEVSKAVLEKVRNEASGIVEEAEAEARRILDEAKERREKRFAAERDHLLHEAEAEAARIVARGTMEARNTLAAAKAGVFDDMIAEARKRLEAVEAKPEHLAKLIKEGIEGLGAGEVEGATLVVSSAHRAAADKLLEADESLRERVSGIEERSIGGGVVLEGKGGGVVVDNTYAARLEMLTPRILVRFRGELFGGNGKE